MGKLDARLAKLELRRGGADCPPVAVVAAPLPDAGLDAWAAALVDGFGWRGRDLGVWVVDAPCRDLLLAPTPMAALSGAREATWLGAAATFPHVQVMVRPEAIATWRMGSQADADHWLRVWKTEVEGEPADG